jgi:hypothetical protein
LKEGILDGTGPLGSDADQFRKLLKTEGIYRNGSEVSILAASPTSVRGPHVPSLKLDEVDEIDPDIRQSAIGMAMAKKGRRSTITMTSTWHRLGGPMSELVDQAVGGAFPFYRFCLFEVLERCPESRSGPELENCPACPLMAWCHEGIAEAGSPKAKRSAGHYTIDSAVQKITATSLKTFEADYLCLGPRADGLWFKAFGAKHVSESAGFDPLLPVHLSIDSGVFTGAVAFQVRPSAVGVLPSVSVFWEYLAENVAARIAAGALLAGIGARRGSRFRVSTDSAGGSRNPVGPTVISEYEQAGLRSIERWPVGSVADSLATLEALIDPADGLVRLQIHPSCRRTIEALQNYRRAKRGGQWQDYPEDPQHPHEDLVDALRGGLRREFPDGFKRPDTMRRVGIQTLRG